MRKTLLLVLGAGLLVFGGVALANRGIPHTVHHSFDIAIAQGSVDTREVWAIHPALAGIALAAGAALLVLGARAK